jgi:5-methylcytosine-specific restriction enzyme A
MTRPTRTTVCPRPGCPHLTPCPTHPAIPWANRTPGATGRPWRTLRAQILKRDRYRCVTCGKPATQVDHTTPRAHGGTDAPDNLRSLCTPCHHRKTVQDRTQPR